MIKLKSTISVNQQIQHIDQYITNKAVTITVEDLGTRLVDNRLQINSIRVFTLLSIKFDAE